MTTETRMVELLCRAMCEAEGQNPDHQSNDPFDEGAHLWTTYRPLARAVLTALRTPTPEMVAHGEGLSDMVLPDGFLNTPEERRKEVAGIFTSMIDAALKQEGEGR